MFENQKFELKPEHVTLLSQAYVSWDKCEFGAPQIDPKRPYGNSDVVLDIVEALAWPITWTEDDEIPEDVVERAEKIHAETKTALQVILAAKSFEPGQYEAPAYSTDWRRV